MIGFGMSAIGYVNDSFFQNHSKLDSYENAIREMHFAVYRGMNLTRDNLIRQYMQQMSPRAAQIALEEKRTADFAFVAVFLTAVLAFAAVFFAADFAFAAVFLVVRLLGVDSVVAIASPC